MCIKDFVIEAGVPEAVPQASHGSGRAFVKLIPSCLLSINEDIISSVQTTDQTEARSRQTAGILQTCLDCVNADR